MVEAKRLKIKNWALIIIFWCVLVITFLFFSFLIILKANGFQLNYKTWKILQTGMIVLDGSPRNSIIKINNRTLKSGFPEKIANLNSGNYEIVITFPSYQTWQKNISVREGMAATYKNIILFKDQSQDTNAPSGLTIDKLTQDSRALSQDITIDDTEIFYQNNLITRFSQSVLGAVIYPDNKHIVFQLGDEIRVIDLDGSNNILLFKLSSALPTFIDFRDSGATLLYIDNGLIKAKIIR